MDTSTENTTKRDRSGSPGIRGIPSTLPSPPRKKATLEDNDLAAPASTATTSIPVQDVKADSIDALQSPVTVPEVSAGTASSSSNPTSAQIKSEGKKSVKDDKAFDKREKIDNRRNNVWEARPKAEGEVRLPKRKVALLIGYVWCYQSHRRRPWTFPINQSWSVSPGTAVQDILGCKCEPFVLLTSLKLEGPTH